MSETLAKTRDIAIYLNRFNLINKTLIDVYVLK